ncbi:MAG: hypothetical protein ABI882_23930 [Acidobacteriota bacterium]
MTPTPTEVQAILTMYIHMPDTPSRHRSADRRLAIDLHTRQVPIEVIESAFLLASVRRFYRHPDRPALAPIRSLAYFIPTIDELLRQPLPAGYLQYLRGKLARVHNHHQTESLLLNV